MIQSSSITYRIMKRLFDILVSFVALFILSPFFLIIAVLIKKESPGPVFFKGERIGLNGYPFSIIKFRTMYHRPDGLNDSPLTAMDDNRITTFGKWLRETKANELPQLWNVLKGEMSLVGPRPEDPSFVEKWPQETRQVILSVRPGITSPASVSYRNEEEKLGSSNIIEEYIYRIAPEKLRLDLLYVKQKSLLVDLDVIFMTFVLLLPRLRQVNPPEWTYFSGPIFQFFSRYLSWFIIDALVAFLSISISGLLWRLGGPLDLGWDVSFGLAVGMTFLFTFFNFLLGVNRISWRQAGPGWILKLMVSCGLVIVVLSALSLSPLPIPKLPLSLTWLAGALTLSGMIIVRYRERLITGMATRWLLFRNRVVGDVAERALIVGAGSGALLVGWMVQHIKSSHAISIVGMVDDDPEKVGMRIGDYRVLGTTEEIPRLVEQKGISLLIFAINSISPQGKKRIVNLCNHTSARLIFIPDYLAMFSNELATKG